ncbi:MAG: 3-hydroxybutyryl-CoA dehydrogenase [Chloroflexota bacterium]
MEADEVKRVCVVGAGTMGNGIAQVLAAAGISVSLVEVAQAPLDRGLATIDKNLTRAVAKGKLAVEEKDATLARISPSLSLDVAADCPFAVEAVIEQFEAKRDVLARLDSVCAPEAVLASNTSSIPLTALGAATRRPGQVVGMHFFNPVPVMALVEVIRGTLTNEESVKFVVALAERLGKTPVLVNDSPGFVSNRILVPMINEAAYALMEGVADREAIDTVMRLGMNHPMGPLTLADFIGLDVCLHIMEILYEGFGDPKYRPCPLLRRMVQAGQLGRKSGRGFYEYGQ